MFRKTQYDAVRAFFRATTWLQYNKTHSAPVYPDDTFSVSPSQIEYKSKTKPSVNTLLNTAVVGGTWDQHVDRIEEDVVYRSFHARFVDGKEWQETPYYSFLKTETSEHGNKSSTEIDRRCERLDSLYHYIKDHGYKSQSELEAESAYVDTLSPSNLLPPEFREISVNISRDGTFLWSSGMHRISIAKLLDVETIPVRVRVRHAKWQSLRNQIVEGTREYAEFETHPDIHPPANEE